ncbi:MAG: ATP-binding protein, partial [Pedosphaera sp.]|nr:ATP-binding protein [Pedosphaera sp.]
SEYVEGKDFILRARVEIALEPVQQFFLGYVVVNMGAMVFFLMFNSWKLRVVHWVTLVMNLVDAMVVSALVVITGGLDSMVYWVFLVLIVRNAISVPIPVTQISVNLLTTAGYAAAIFIWKGWIAIDPMEALDELAPRVGPATPEEIQAVNQPAEQYEGSLFTIRVFFLVLMTAVCYGVQVLFDRDRQAQSEAREYSLRREQLRSTGRLAAEIAHRLKNPLAIINNAAFSLGRHMEEGNTVATRQLNMIRGEVERSDMILTELMGYARLSEGRVEKIDMKEELQGAIEEAFPPNHAFHIQLKKDLHEGLPPLMMQRAHLREIMVNLLVNAREAAGENGIVQVSCRPSPQYAIELRVKDSGEGIPPDQREQIFEAYFTTKKKGTGLGLAIVKQNTELYGGEIVVESELGVGTEFILTFPTRVLLQENES